MIAAKIHVVQYTMPFKLKAKGSLIHGFAAEGQVSLSSTCPTRAIDGRKYDKAQFMTVLGQTWLTKMQTYRDSYEYNCDAPYAYPMFTPQCLLIDILQQDVAPHKGSTDDFTMGSNIAVLVVWMSHSCFDVAPYKAPHAHDSPYIPCLLSPTSPVFDPKTPS